MSNKLSITNQRIQPRTNSQNIADKFTELADRLLAFPDKEAQFRIELDDMSGQLYSAISNFSNNLSTTDTILFRQPGKFNPLYNNTTITSTLIILYWNYETIQTLDEDGLIKKSPAFNNIKNQRLPFIDNIKIDVEYISGSNVWYNLKTKVLLDDEDYYDYTSDIINANDISQTPFNIRIYGSNFADNFPSIEERAIVYSNLSYGLSNPPTQPTHVENIISDNILSTWNVSYVENSQDYINNPDSSITLETYKLEITEYENITSALYPVNTTTNIIQDNIGNVQSNNNFNIPINNLKSGTKYNYRIQVTNSITDTFSQFSDLINTDVYTDIPGNNGINGSLNFTIINNNNYNNFYIDNVVKLYSNNNILLNVNNNTLINIDDNLQTFQLTNPLANKNDTSGFGQYIDDQLNIANINIYIDDQLIENVRFDACFNATVPIKTYANIQEIYKDSNLNVISTTQGNHYVFNNLSNDSFDFSYGLTNGTYTIKNIPSNHPFALLNNGQTTMITYTGDINKRSLLQVNGIQYSFYYGDITINVFGNFGVISGYCYNHGYMGLENRITYINSFISYPETSVQDIYTDNSRKGFRLKSSINFNKITGRSITDLFGQPSDIERTLKIEYIRDNIIDSQYNFNKLYTIWIDNLDGLPIINNTVPSITQTSIEYVMGIPSIKQFNFIIKTNFENINSQYKFIREDRKIAEYRYISGGLGSLSIMGIGTFTDLDANSSYLDSDGLVIYTYTRIINNSINSTGKYNNYIREFTNIKYATSVINTNHNIKFTIKAYSLNGNSTNTVEHNTRHYFDLNSFTDNNISNSKIKMEKNNNQDIDVSVHQIINISNISKISDLSSSEYTNHQTKIKDWTLLYINGSFNTNTTLPYPIFSDYNFNTQNSSTFPNGLLAYDLSSGAVDNQNGFKWIVFRLNTSNISQVYIAGADTYYYNLYSFFNRNNYFKDIKHGIINSGSPYNLGLGNSSNPNGIDTDFNSISTHINRRIHCFIKYNYNNFERFGIVTRQFDPSNKWYNYISPTSSFYDTISTPNMFNHGCLRKVDSTHWGPEFPDNNINDFYLYLGIDNQYNF